MGGGCGYNINNQLQGQSKVELDGVKFTSGWCKFGGGLFIFSPDKKSPINIKNCHFKGCTVSATTDSSSDLFGFYLTVTKCEVTFCTFINNKIPGGHIKVNECFTSNPDGLKLLNSNSNLTAISVSILLLNFWKFRLFIVLFKQLQIIWCWRHWRKFQREFGQRFFISSMVCHTIWRTQILTLNIAWIMLIKMMQLTQSSSKLFE